MSIEQKIVYGLVPSDIQQWHPGIDITTPCFFSFRPAIYCYAAQLENGCAVQHLPEIPWHAANIVAVECESRKAYELLKKLIPQDYELTIYIGTAVYEYMPEKQPLVALYTNGHIEEMALAAEIAANLGGISWVIAGYPGVLIKPPLVSVFIDWAATCSDRVLSAPASVITSNAGAHEEMLTRMSMAGHRWHVAKTWEAREWVEMIKDLLDMPNETYQVAIVDQTPYIKNLQQESTHA